MRGKIPKGIDFDELQIPLTAMSIITICVVHFRASLTWQSIDPSLSNLLLKVNFYPICVWNVKPNCSDKKNL